MKNIKIISLIIGMLIALLCGSFYKKAIQESVSFSSSFNIHKLTDKEYEEVGVSGLDNPIKDDFRKAEIKVEMQHTNKIKNRKIIVPTMTELKNAINSYDMERYWFGNASEEDNENTNSAKYVFEFIFYSKGLDDNDIAMLFSDLEISASWLDQYGNIQKENYLLSDIISFTY